MESRYARQCSLMIHNPSASAAKSEEVILNPEVFPDMRPGALIQIYDPDAPSNLLVLKVPSSNLAPTGRMEISILKSIADAAGLKQFSRVVVDFITEEEARVDFVELSFRKQYLQRGNMLRFKNALLGRTVYQNQIITINSLQANVQEIRKMDPPKALISGVITNSTKFVFRSRSARIVWLVQISVEMWDVDKNGNMYFEKFLKEFVGPVFDSWKALGVSHMLTVIFFARSLYLDDRIAPNLFPELLSKKSMIANDGYYQQDHIKIVLENIEGIDKHKCISKLRSELWTFAKNCGWKIPDLPNMNSNAANRASQLDAWSSTQSLDALDDVRPSKIDDTRPRAGTDATKFLSCIVPSDSMHGNFLESINITLNILDKHYMDRDLTRTGNAIVLITAGTGIFKVKPRLARITKQRMLDNAFGIDCVSMSRPPVHSVPLFVVDGKRHKAKDFYEVPHWMRVSYSDCKTAWDNAKFLEAFSVPEINQMLESNWDDVWAQEVNPHPVSTFLSSQLGYYSFLVSQFKAESEALGTLRSNYAQLLPFALRNFLQHCQQQSQLQAQQLTISPSPTGGNRDATSTTVDESVPSLMSKVSSVSLISQQLAQPVLPEEAITPWGLLTGPTSQIDVFKKSVILQHDVDALRKLSKSPTSALAIGGKMLPEIFDSIPVLKNVKEENAAGSYNSNMGEHMSRGGVTSMAQSVEDTQGMDRFTELQVRAMSKERDAHHHPAGSFGSRLLNSSQHDDGGASVGNSSHAATIIGNVSKYESIVVRKEQLHELSGADDLDYDHLTEIFLAYDMSASTCFKRSVAASINLHEDNGGDKTLPSDHRIDVDEDTGKGNRANHSNSKLSTKMGNSNIVSNSKVASAAKGTVKTPPLCDATSRSVGATTSATGANHPSMAASSGPTVSAQLQAQKHLRSPPRVAYGAALPPSKSVSINKAGGNTPGTQSLPFPSMPTNASTTAAVPVVDAVANSSSAVSSQESAAASMTGSALPARKQPVPRDRTADRLFQASIYKNGGGMKKHQAQSSTAPRFLPPSADSSTTSKIPGMASSNASFTASNTATNGSSQLKAANAAGASLMGGAASSSSGLNTALSKAGARGVAPHIHGAPPNLPPTAVGMFKGDRYMMMTRGKFYMNVIPVAQPQTNLTDKELEEFVEYEGKYAANPFRQKDGVRHLSQVTHNRRRWAHVFPVTRIARAIDYRINWKSLTQPAILPLNTDYFPKLAELQTNYTIEESHFRIDFKSCPFATFASAMLELVCQRLSHEYQLIENFDRSTCLKLSKCMLTSKADALYYVLTMGHRIHVLVGDPKVNQIWVTRYTSKGGRNEEEKKEGETDRTRVHYKYEMWSTQNEKFHTLTQSFALFPDEFQWTDYDGIILGDVTYDGNLKGRKPRGLKYVIIPPAGINTVAAMDDYYEKIDQLVEFLNKNVPEKDEPMLINKDRSILPAAESSDRFATLWYRQTSREIGVMRRMLRGAHHDNPNWLYVKYDRNLYSFRAFHFHLEWFICDSWEVNDFVNTLFRRCAKVGLRLCQTPGYFASHDLNIHPFRPIPYVQVPNTTNNVMQLHSSAMRVVERIVFARSGGEWIFDSERNTDWVGIGLPFPNYSDRDRDILQVEGLINSMKNGTQPRTAGGAVLASTPTSQQTSTPKNTGPLSDLFGRFFRRHQEDESSENVVPSGSSSTGNVSSSLTPSVATAESSLASSSSYPRLMAKRFDRQYIQCQGLATVRVGGQGFLWLPSASAKISDLNTPAEERAELARKKFAALEQAATHIVDCYEILMMDIVEPFLNLPDDNDIRLNVTDAQENGAKVGSHNSTPRGESSVEDALVRSEADANSSLKK